MAENHHIARLPPCCLAAAVLALLVAAYYWKLILTDQYTWLSGDDITAQVLPWFQHQAGEWHQGRFPLWDPNHWAGQPLPGQAQPGAMYPPNWLLFSLPLRGGWLKQAWLHGYFVLIHIAGALFAFLLARRLGASRPGAVLGGLVFTLSGYMGQLDWPQMLNSALWAPLTALFLVRWTASWRWQDAVWAGFIHGVSWLGGHHQTPIYVSCACLLVSVWALWRRWGDWRVILGVAMFWAMAAMAGAAQILPAVEYGREALRWVGAPEPVGWKDQVPYTVHIQWSMAPAGLLGLVLPYAHTHASPFLGFTALSLALLGAVWNWRLAAVRGLTLLFLLGLLLAMAHFTPLHGWFYALLPMVDKARNASTAVFLCGLAASPLAALGLSGIASHAASPWLRRVMLAGLGFATLVFAVRLVLILVMPYPGVGENRDVLIAAVALAVSALLAAFRSGHLSRFALAAALIFLSLCEYTGHAGAFFPNVKTQPEFISGLAAMRAHGDIAEFLRRQPGLFRVEVDSEAIKYNFGDWHGLHQSGGYLASVTRKIYEKGIHDSEIANLLGVAYRVGLKPDPRFPALVYESPSGLKVWKNPDAKPRVYSVRDGDFAEAAAYRPGYVKIAASLARPGLVVFAENHYPGWRVAIDGQPARLGEAYGFLMAVHAPAGAHWIEFEYRPRSVYLGAALSLAALFVAAGSAFFPNNSLDSKFNLG